LSIPEVLKSKPNITATVDNTVPVLASTSTSSNPYVDNYNVSNGTSRHYLNLLNTSVNCDKGRERHHKAVMDEIQASQNDNASHTLIIDKLTKSRLTVGSMTRCGIWALSETALQIVENKNKAKLNALAGRASKQYIRDMKIYSNGKVPLKPAFSERVAEVRDSPNSLNSFKILSYIIMTMGMY
jgi:hypothetical protein